MPEQGVTEEVKDRCDYILEPIEGKDTIISRCARPWLSSWIGC
jgi:hypothetical protein